MRARSSGAEVEQRRPRRLQHGHSQPRPAPAMAALMAALMASFIAGVTRLPQRARSCRRHRRPSAAPSARPCGTSGPRHATPAAQRLQAGAVVHAVAVLGHRRVDAQQGARRPGTAARRSAKGGSDLDGAGPGAPGQLHRTVPRRSPASGAAGRPPRAPRRRSQQPRASAHASWRARASIAPNSCSPFFQAMRSATSRGRSASHWRDQRACSTT